MAHQQNHSDLEEDPLSPELEQMRRRMTRFVFGSIGVMMIGLVAIFAVIIYRVGGFDEAPVIGADTAQSAAVQQSGALQIPVGSQIVETSLDGTRLVLRLRLSDGSMAIHLFDLNTGNRIGQFSVEPNGAEE